jgi:spermidine synthase
MKKLIFVSIILTGITSLSSQIIFMREFFTVFYGNELCLGFFLGSWLIFGGLGSYFLSRFPDRIGNKFLFYSLFQIILGVTIFVTLLEIRFSKLFLHIYTGELVGFIPMAITSLIVIAPLCVFSGFMFTFACSIYKDDVTPSVGIGKVYTLESLGSIIGGLVSSFIFIKYLSSMNAILILSFLNMLFAFLISLKLNKKHISFFISIFLLVFLIFGYTVKIWSKIDNNSLKFPWKEYNFLESKNSIYGNISVIERDKQISFLENGSLLYTMPNTLDSEESAHFCLLEHPDPKKVLLIGGGLGGLVKEILKENVEKVDYLEMDPVLINLFKKYMPNEFNKFLMDNRVSIKNVDARFFVKNTKTKYDCIIIHMGDSSTIGLNRFYTREFFIELKNILNKDGIVSFGVTSAEDYINPELRNFLRSLYLTLSSVFEDVKVIPGYIAYFLGCNSKNILTYDYKVLAQRQKERNLHLSYVRDYYLSSRMTDQKISYLENILKDEKNKVSINTDFKPVSYYYNAVFWSTYFHNSILRKVLKHIDYKFIIVSLTFVFLFFVLYVKKNIQKAVNLSIIITGFSEMSFQIITLLSFQVIYGYVFYKLSIIVTSFMIGLFLGSYLITKNIAYIKNDVKLFIYTQIGICLYPLILPVFFLIFRNSQIPFFSYLGENMFFPFAPILAGFMGGVQFPLASKININSSNVTAKGAGKLYFMDLLGSSLGALLVGAFIVPIIGIINSCILISVINFFVLVLALQLSRDSSSKVTCLKA